MQPRSHNIVIIITIIIEPVHRTDVTRRLERR